MAYGFPRGARVLILTTPLPPPAACSQSNAESLGRGWRRGGDSFQLPKGSPPGVTCSPPLRAWLGCCPVWSACSSGPRQRYPSSCRFCLPTCWCVYLFILRFAEARRPAALQPRHGGADHDNGVSGHQPGTGTDAGGPLLRASLDPGMRSSRKRCPCFRTCVHFFFKDFFFPCEEGQDSSLIWYLNEKFSQIEK